MLSRDPRLFLKTYNEMWYNCYTMELVTVGSKYQVVIPKKIRKKMEIQPGDMVGLLLEDTETVKIKTKPKSWVERTYGLMKDEWKDMDPIAELEKMRNEWERKP